MLKSITRFTSMIFCVMLPALWRGDFGNEYSGPDVNGIVFRKRPSLHSGRVKYD